MLSFFGIAMRHTKYIIGFLLFANFFAASGSYWLSLGRPLFNVDYVLLLLFCCFPKNIFSKFILLIIYFIIFSIDLLLMTLQIFPFVRLTDLVYLSNFIFNGPVLYRSLLLLSMFVFLVSFLIIRDLFFKKLKLTIKEFSIIIGLAIIILFVKHLVYPIKEDALDSRFNKEWIGSQLLFFSQHQKSNFLESFGNSTNKLEPLRFDYSTKPLFEKLKNNKPLSSKILLVVNESWGETSNPQHQAAILESIYKQKNHLEFIRQGSFNFVGATVAGEIRELCHKQPRTFNLKGADAAEFNDCLPNQLQQIGYQTHAMHGAMSMMYDRSSWYPQAGFRYLRFFEQLPTIGVCKSFSGRCDIELIPQVKQQLLSSQKSFVYWMTLNTHAPYDDAVFIGGLSCVALKVKQGSETCNNYKLQHQFFTALSKLIADPSMKGVEIYVVGDHSPPIFNLRDNFFSFKGSDVAWVHFKINK